MSAQVGQQPPMTAVQKLSAVNEQTWLSMGKSHAIFFPSDLNRIDLLILVNSLRCIGGTHDRLR